MGKGFKNEKHRKAVMAILASAGAAGGGVAAHKMGATKAAGKILRRGGTKARSVGAAAKSKSFDFDKLKKLATGDELKKITRRISKLLDDMQPRKGLRNVKKGTRKKLRKKMAMKSVRRKDYV